MRKVEESSSGFLTKVEKEEAEYEALETNGISDGEEDELDESQVCFSVFCSFWFSSLKCVSELKLA